MTRFYSKDAFKHGLPPIFFLTSFVYEFDIPFNDVTCIFAEPKLNQFIKFSSNSGAHTDYPIAELISHYSYDRSGGYFMISDI